MARNSNNLFQQLIAGLSLQSILLHPATWFICASVATLIGSIQLWNAYQADIVDQEKYRLTADKIHLPTPPSWSDSDLKKLVLQNNAGNTEPSLLDTGLVSRTVNAFRKVGWIEKVQSVEKSKDGLDIELTYRLAVGVVELNHLTISQWPANQPARLLPVDRQGVIMPGELAADRKLLRFSIFNPANVSTQETWTKWPDKRVQAAAAIGDAIGARGIEFGLYRIVTFRKPGQPEERSVPFELWPDNGTQVIWGNPPGQEVATEASAAEKIQAIEEFVANYGQLNRLPKQRIDVRSGKAIVVGNAKIAKLESLGTDHR